MSTPYDPYNPYYDPASIPTSQGEWNAQGYWVPKAQNVGMYTNPIPGVPTSAGDLFGDSPTQGMGYGNVPPPFPGLSPTDPGPHQGPLPPLVPPPPPRPNATGEPPRQGDPAPSQSSSGGSVAQQWMQYAPSVPPPPTPVPTTPSQPARDPKWDELYQMLLQRAQQGLAVDRTDPAIRTQSDAYNAQLQRSQRNYLGDVAEAQGPNANIQGERRMSSERVGIASGGFEAQLLGREIEARRAEIATALTEMRHMLTADQQLALQRELGYLDDATKRFGISTEDATRRLGIGTDADLRRMAIAAEMDQFLGQLGFQQSESDRLWDSRYRGFDF